MLTMNLRGNRIFNRVKKHRYQQQKEIINKKNINNKENKKKPKRGKGIASNVSDLVILEEQTTNISHS